MFIEVEPPTCHHDWIEQDGLMVCKHCGEKLDFEPTHIHDERGVDVGK